MPQMKRGGCRVSSKVRSSAFGHTRARRRRKTSHGATAEHGGHGEKRRLSAAHAPRVPRRNTALTHPLKSFERHGRTFVHLGGVKLQNRKEVKGGPMAPWSYVTWNRTGGLILAVGKLNPPFAQPNGERGPPNSGLFPAGDYSLPCCNQETVCPKRMD